MGLLILVAFDDAGVTLPGQAVDRLSCLDVTSSRIGNVEKTRSGVGGDNIMFTQALDGFNCQTLIKFERLLKKRSVIKTN